MDLSDDDIKSVERWHKKEWDQFREEIVAYKIRVLDKIRDTYLWNKENCIACNKMREFKSKRRQRGSIILGAANSKHASSDPGNCTYTQSTIPNLSDFEFEPSNAYTRGRLHSDGSWYSSESSSWGAADGTWQGGCAVADYDTRWIRNSGDVPNNVVSGTDSTWAAATTSKAVGYTRSFGSYSGSFTMECRDGTTLATLFTDSFNMDCEVEPKN